MPAGGNLRYLYAESWHTYREGLHSAPFRDSLYLTHSCIVEIKEPSPPLKLRYSAMVKWYRMEL